MIGKRFRSLPFIFANDNYTLRAVRNKSICSFTKSLIFHFLNFIHMKAIRAHSYSLQISLENQFQKNVLYSIIPSFIRPPPVLK